MINKIRNILEQVLDESLAEIKDKYYQDIPQSDFEEIIMADPTFKLSKDRLGTYGKWLLRLYKNKNLKIEDLYKATEYLNDFEELKKIFQK